jgi:Cu-Zn family superoxide dismutase
MAITRKNKRKRWSAKYKRSINCKRPKGFSQKQYCKYGRKHKTRKHRLKAVAIMKKKNNVSGKVVFTQLKNKLKVEYNIKGMKDGKHGFHVHEIGNFKGDCKKAGPHFNPDHFTHGARTCFNRHAGDLGNVISKNKVAKGSFTDKRLSLRKNSKYYIVNRSIIVHDLKDDLGRGKNEESLKTGNAGARLNCAKIKLI